MTKENLLDAIERSVVPQDTERLFAQGWESIHRQETSDLSQPQ
jgi:hypothetical protein